MNKTHEVKAGLEGVIVAETRLSEVDGTAGELLIQGCRLEQFTGLGYEGAAARLLGDKADLTRGRQEAYSALLPFLGLLNGRSPVEALRLGLAALPSDSLPEVIAGSLPTLLAAAHHGASTPPPNPAQSYVEDLLTRRFSASDGSASTAEVEALSCYLTTVAEHGMNASTFTARVIASTGAPLLDAVGGALSALKGPLHGGAPGPVLDLLDEMAPHDRAGRLLEALLEKTRQGQRLMGFGHRIYRTRDPRADVLKGALAGLSGSPRLELAQRVEGAALEALRIAKPNRPLDTNVEFYTAVLLDRLGFSREEFTPLFATGRVLGWLAHALEQRELGRLIRPDSVYVGPRP